MNDLQVPEEGQETLLKSWTDWLVDILVLSAHPSARPQPNPPPQGAACTPLVTQVPAVDHSTVPER